MHKCVAVWIDDDAAKIFPIQPDQLDRAPAVPEPQYVRPRGDEHVGRHYGEVARALDDAEEILLLGASKAKLGFLKYLHAHEAILEPRLVGIETREPCTDGQLVAYAHRYFNP